MHVFNLKRLLINYLFFMKLAENHWEKALVRETKHQLIDSFISACMLPFPLDLANENLIFRITMARG